MYGSFVCLCFVCHMHQASAPGGEPQETKTTPDHENKVAVSAALTYVVEFNKRGCKELETFGGGTLSLKGNGHNSVNGGATKKLRMNLKRQTVQ